MCTTTETPSAVTLPTPDQVRLIQASWQTLKPARDQVGDLFYQRLFEIDPSLRMMFGPDIAQQGRKLVTMLSAVVDGLARLDALLPAVNALGQRHGSYGVRPAHYESVGQALLWTLRRGLGPDATAPVIDAWAVAYATLAAAMQAAASEHQESPAEMPTSTAERQPALAA